MTSRRGIRGMRPEDWALVDRACVLARTTPRALILTAANVVLRERTRREFDRAAADLDAEERAAAEAATPQIALPLGGRHRSTR